MDLIIFDPAGTTALVRDSVQRLKFFPDETNIFGSGQASYRKRAVVTVVRGAISLIDKEIIIWHEG
jgi:hypothetical protein